MFPTNRISCNGTSSFLIAILSCSALLKESSRVTTTLKDNLNLSMMSLVAFLLCIVTRALRFIVVCSVDSDAFLVYMGFLEYI